ncbi:Cyclin, C-terminal domain [Dillenia turbinata]|uniref:Cyclin, C-terminal domain n=1 Tax=Dillenia turbinata TaxID=194707 RepID=A0AAN8VXF2_9MAGN
MAGKLPGNYTECGTSGDAADLCDADVPQCSTCGWYFTRKEIEDYSPSRKDGIDLEIEVVLRESYSSFLRDLGKTLKVLLLSVVVIAYGGQVDRTELLQGVEYRQALLCSGPFRAKFSMLIINPTVSEHMKCTSTAQRPHETIDIVVERESSSYTKPTSTFRLWHLKSSSLKEVFITQSHDVNSSQLTIASSVMLCHRFYMRQSHAKNDWQNDCSSQSEDANLQTVAPVCMFLACKVEESPRSLKTVIVETYKLLNRWDPCAEGRINKREVYDKQKALILTGEKLLLETIAFDLNIEHPYKPLVAALRRLEITNTELVQVAWNFINDWVCTALCLEYKPHYIAASSLLLASKLLKMKLPTTNGKVWWLAFDVAPKKLEEIVQKILGFLEQNKTQSRLSIDWKTRKTTHSDKRPKSESPESCILSGSTPIQSTALDAVGPSAVVTPECKNLAGDDCIVTEKEPLQCQTSQCRSEITVLEDVAGEVQPATEKSQQNLSICSGLGKIDMSRIREIVKKRSSDIAVNKQAADLMKDADSGEAWIERELEYGVESVYTSAEKRPKQQAIF